MKKLLITGENGFIGSAFRSYMQQWPEQYQPETISVRDETWKDKSFCGYDVVCHFAGIAHSDIDEYSEEQKKLYYKVNAELTEEIAKKAKIDGVRQFVFMSSSIVYGEAESVGREKVVTEETLLCPSNFYGDSKVVAEQKIKPLEDELFKVCIIRSPMVYGKGTNGNYTTLRKIARKCPVFPKIKNERSMIYIGNLVEFIRLMVDNYESGIFFPQNGEYSNTSELVKMIAEENGKKVVLVPGFGWLIKLLGKKSKLINKAFGNFVYDRRVSEYKEDYRKYSLRGSIKETEE